jgi:hypothetical protein
MSASFRNLRAPFECHPPGGVSGCGVAAHHDVGVAALLEVGIKDRLADRAPVRLPLQQVQTDNGASGFSSQHPPQSV